MHGDLAPPFCSEETKARSQSESKLSTEQWLGLSSVPHHHHHLSLSHSPKSTQVREGWEESHGLCSLGDKTDKGEQAEKHTHRHIQISTQADMQRPGYTSKDTHTGTTPIYCIVLLSLHAEVPFQIASSMRKQAKRALTLSPPFRWLHSSFIRATLHPTVRIPWDQGNGPTRRPHPPLGFPIGYVGLHDSLLEPFGQTLSIVWHS